MNIISKLVNLGFDVSITNKHNRLGDPQSKERGFYIRKCWKVSKNDFEVESIWEGFESAESAIENMALTLKSLENSIFNGVDF